MIEMKSAKSGQSFEQAMERLEEIVSTLEKDDTPLDDSMALYKEGATLAAFCSKKLQKAQQVITQIHEKPEQKKKEEK